IRFGATGLIKSLREVPTFLLMRLAFGAGLCRFGMFRAVRAKSGVSEVLSTKTGDRLVKSNN
ncbi:MAG: SAM-dependent methyltransferase, partial [Symploca sp. SIO1C2]|nr:SAM-dependent methyltransferase [Symploca sp. SIO1C2]